MMVLAESLAVGALVKVGNNILDYVVPIKKYSDSPRIYDLSQGYLIKPIPVQKTRRSQLESLSKMLDYGKSVSESEVKLESNKSRPEFVPIQEKKSNQKVTSRTKHNTNREEQEKELNQKQATASKYYSIREKQDQGQGSKLTSKQIGDDEPSREFALRQQSNRTLDINREIITSQPVELDQNKQRYPNSKHGLGHKKKRSPSKFYTVADQNYVQVDVTSQSPTFIPIETKVALDETTIWTGDKYAREVDPIIYDIQSSETTDCLYTNENGPGTCFIKSHDGFYLMGPAYFSDPFDCYSNFYNVTVEKDIEFEPWESSFHSPLTTSQLIKLIKPPLPPAPRFNQLSFNITCPGLGVKRVAFKPLLYKVRGVSYNTQSKLDKTHDRDAFQDIHFPVLLAAGVVHGIYAVVDYPVQ